MFTTGLTIVRVLLYQTPNLKLIILIMLIIPSLSPLFLHHLSAHGGDHIHQHRRHRVFLLRHHGRHHRLGVHGEYRLH